MQMFEEPHAAREPQFGHACIMPFKFEGKEMYPIFVFANFWSIHSKVVRLGKNAHSKQRKNISTQTLQFHVKYICMPCWFSIYSRDHQPS